MAEDPTLRLIQETDLPAISGWEDVPFVDEPSVEWLHLVIFDTQSEALVVLQDDEIIAYGQIDFTAATGHIALVVKHAFRGCGIGAKLEHALCHLAEERKVTCLQAAIDVRNMPSMFAFVSYGYACGDETGDLLNYTKLLGEAGA